MALGERSEPQRSSLNILRLICGLLFLLPALLLWSTTLLTPTQQTFDFSQEKFNGLTAAQPVGTLNFDKLSQDPLFQSAIKFTSELVSRRIVVVAILPLLLAVALNEFRRILRIPARLL